MTESLNDLLVRLGACKEAKNWAEGQPDLQTAWRNCKQPDWMLWLLLATGYDNQRVLRLIACSCVRETPLSGGRTVWDLLTDPRSRAAVEVAERFARGLATRRELDAAADALWAARAAVDAAGAAGAADAADAAWAAVDATRDASLAAWAARAARDAAWAAEDAAQAAAWAAADALWAARAAWDAAVDVVEDAARAAQSDIIRRYLPNFPEEEKP